MFGTEFSDDNRNTGPQCIVNIGFDGRGIASCILIHVDGKNGISCGVCTVDCTSIIFDGVGILSPSGTIHHQQICDACITDGSDCRFIS